ncbi:uncharacterized protein LOC128671248 isoform X2 [Plodia interpunctella]|uniref:uncharacterized protein LOC128671248 isoform X2 n=1 Tax=Plodia interpunctella TaxID=58824 RepID=UPI0023683945|nr:uncharacterized protein LOC128671248 isoform X2 [Plodia interpunctella]
MWKKIKAYYNKEGYDYSKGFGKPTEFHSSFYFMMQSFQVMHKPYPKFSYFTKSFTMICGIGVFIDAYLDLYHAVDVMDIFMLTEAGTYAILLTYKAMIMASTWINKDNFLHLLQAMTEDFEYINTKNERYKKKFFETHLGTWKATLWCYFFMFALGMGQIAFACLYLMWYYMTHTAGDGSVRPLVFPFWAPGIDYTKTPAFELAFVFANLGVAAYSFHYLFILQTDVVWIRQIASKAELIILNIHDLLDGIKPAATVEEEEHYSAMIRFRMREIISKTQSILIENYAAVYKKMLMYEQFFSSPTICMLAYCSAEKLDKGEIQAQMMLLCTGAMITLYIPCYLITFLRSKISDVSDACWEIPFWDAPPVTVRVYINLIMQRCLRPLPLQAPGFEEVSIKTFSNKMTSAYSYFNMLRQADFEL